MVRGYEDGAHTSTQPDDIDYCSTHNHHQRLSSALEATTPTNRERTEAKLITPAPVPLRHVDQQPPTLKYNNNVIAPIFDVS